MTYTPFHPDQYPDYPDKGQNCENAMKERRPSCASLPDSRMPRGSRRCLGVFRLTDIYKSYQSSSIFGTLISRVAAMLQQGCRGDTRHHRIVIILGELA
jgi:hypothetical protein